MASVRLSAVSAISLYKRLMFRAASRASAISALPEFSSFMGSGQRVNLMPCASLFYVESCSFPLSPVSFSWARGSWARGATFSTIAST